MRTLALTIGILAVGCAQPGNDGPAAPENRLGTASLPLTASVFVSGFSNLYQAGPAEPGSTAVAPPRRLPPTWRRARPAA